ncbi:uncharacterized protein BDZ83DRAFT_443302 [Colletotrichum acutatum]|uniref:Uncharacterized protein n=1 Tax=Glomerella acutata TaxID=27357 RepID=A0AAD8UF93_GLOAC|nr:uncharacterized protein BDZ83DRAFT_443302 [Colletotrichum acutatum]KAK1720351.1 hypothetical protein BDZ83DRAFT_443302 [Colletotrichum acutatum]
MGSCLLFSSHMPMLILSSKNYSIIVIVVSSATHVMVIMETKSIRYISPHLPTFKLTPLLMKTLFCLTCPLTFYLLSVTLEAPRHRDDVIRHASPLVNIQHHPLTLPLHHDGSLSLPSIFALSPHSAHSSEQTAAVIP